MIEGPIVGCLLEAEEQSRPELLWECAKRFQLERTVFIGQFLGCS